MLKKLVNIGKWGIESLNTRFLLSILYIFGTQREVEKKSQSYYLAFVWERNIILGSETFYLFELNCKFLYYS